MSYMSTNLLADANGLTLSVLYFVLYFDVPYGSVGYCTV
jgi:hypothetical protein